MLTSMQRPSGITWLVAPGLAMIAITYGLARFAYGLFLPEMWESVPRGFSTFPRVEDLA
jgi:hypothetical protein